MITKLRASKISIETPKEGAETWIHITIQQVLREDDGTLINTIPRFDYISIPFQEVGMNFYDGIEPLTQEPTHLSGYAIGTSVAAIVIGQMMEKYGGSVTAEGDLII